MSLSTVELKTILLLANHGPLTGYDLHSKKKLDGSGKDADTNIMSDVYWLKVREKLLNTNFIKDYPEEGRRKPYILGENGFDYLIQNHFEEIHCFDVFAEYCSDHFPLVFRFWGNLKKNGLDLYVKKALRRTIEDIYADVIREIALGLRTRFTHNEFVEALSVRLYLPELFYNEDISSETIPFKVIREFRNERPEIREFIIQWIINQEKILNQKIIKLGQVKQSML